jgi:hypothetical protein
MMHRASCSPGSSEALSANNVVVSVRGTSEVPRTVDIQKVDNYKVLYHKSGCSALRVELKI